VLFIPGDTATATVTINIVNVNESPAFEHSTYAATISENTLNGVDIIRIPATDVDSGDILTYTITGTGIRPKWTLICDFLIFCSIAQAASGKKELLG
jgi:hypothetical protein